MEKPANPGKIKAQSAVEYFMTYGLGLLFLATVVALLFFYLNVPKTSVPNKCTLASGAYCNEVILAANTASQKTQVAFSFTNSQPYALQNPQATASITNFGPNSVSCIPNYIAPGGSIVCVVNVPNAIQPGILLTGSIDLNAMNCGLTTNALCQGAQRQTYSGTFSGHVEPASNSIQSASISLGVANTTQYATNLKDQLTANVLLLGFPIAGATVTFNANPSGFNLQPNVTTTNTGGSAVSYIWGTQTGTVQVTATYAGINSVVTIQFVPPP